MLEGLQDVKLALEKKGIPFIIQSVSPDEGIIEVAKEGALIIVDKGYLRVERQWRSRVANCYFMSLNSGRDECSCACWCSIREGSICCSDHSF